MWMIKETTGCGSAFEDLKEKNQMTFLVPYRTKKLHENHHVSKNCSLVIVVACLSTFSMHKDIYVFSIVIPQ